MLTPIDHLTCASARVRLRSPEAGWLRVPLVLPAECCCGHGPLEGSCRNGGYCPAGTVCVRCVESWRNDWDLQLPQPVEVRPEVIGRVLARREVLGVQWLELAEVTGLPLGTISSMGAKAGRQRVHLDGLGFARLMCALGLTVSGHPR